jgi:hypothetical protein
MQPGTGFLVPGGTVTITVTAGGGVVRVEVADRGADVPGGRQT